MTISKQLPAGKTKAAAEISCSMGAGNIVPHWWYHEIKAAGDKSDLVAITLLSELWFLYRKIGGIEFSDGYAYFERKFEFSRAQLQEATLRLHSAGIATRSFRTVLVYGRKFPNELHLQINLTNLLSLKARYITGDDHNNEDDDIFHNKVFGNFTANTSEKPLEHISRKERSLRKNRSTEASLFKNAFSGLAQSKSDLASFYPLAQLDIALLQKTSARNFTMLAINEILLKLSKRHPEHRFQSKDAFISYMTKVLANEMRDAVKISGESFRSRTNETAEEIKDRKQEEFLTGIEYSLQVSPEWHLKKKLCSVLEREKAYNLLSSYRHCRLEGDTFEIYLTKEVYLTNLDKEIILNQVKTSHESADLATGNFISISALKVVTLPPIAKTEEEATVRQQSAELPVGIWGSIRKALIGYYGKEEEALDRLWFSQLAPEVDEQKKTIKLKASTEFIKDWISRNYAQVLERYLGKWQYSYVIC